MAHHCSYNIHAKITKKGMTIYYEACYKEKRLDVIKEVFTLEGGFKTYIRNLTYNYCAGYLVYFPGESYWTYSNHIATLEKWQECNSVINVSVNYYDIHTYKEQLKELFPEFVYLIKKCDTGNIKCLYNVIQFANKYRDRLSEVEWLVENNQYMLLTDKVFSMPRNSQFFKFIKENKGNYNMTLKKVKFAIKNNIDYLTAEEAFKVGCDLKLVAYLNKQNEYYSFYKDYKQLAKKCGKNLDDPYWKYPKELRKTHNELMQELKEVEKKKQLEARQEMNKALSRFKQYMSNVDGYNIYFPNDIEDIINQAEELNQCLISCKYDEKYAKGKTLLIFMKEENEPVATCEINDKKEIQQFYADERAMNREEAKPSEKMQNAMSKFLNMLPKRVRLCKI